MDVGLRTGLALFTVDGRLLWARTRHLPDRTRLRRAVRGWLDELPGLAWVVLEGGGPLRDLWEKEARRRGLGVLVTQADQWRAEMLLPRQRRSGAEAKRHALAAAQRFAREVGAAPPTPLKPDAAEAVLLGRWAWKRLHATRTPDQHPDT